MLQYEAKLNKISWKFKPHNNAILSSEDHFISVRSAFTRDLLTAANRKFVKSQPTDDERCQRNLLSGTLTSFQCQREVGKITRTEQMWEGQFFKFLSWDFFLYKEGLVASIKKKGERLQLTRLYKTCNKLANSFYKF